MIFLSVNNGNCSKINGDKRTLCGMTVILHDKRFLYVVSTYFFHSLLKQTRPLACGIIYSIVDIHLGSHECNSVPAKIRINGGRLPFSLSLYIDV